MELGNQLNSMNMQRRILVVDDTRSIHDDFHKILNPRTSQKSHSIEELEKKLFNHKENHIVKNYEVLYQIDSAFQGEQAIEMVQKAFESKKPYALIFMDIRMPPGLDGIETIKRIWKVQPDVETVICTAYSDYPWDRIINELGATDKLLFLKKPFEAVAVKQMALSLSTKWNLEQMVERYVDNLQNVLKDREKEIEIHKAKTLETAKLAALGEMAAGVAHEINNPLTIIHGNADFINDILDNKDKIRVDQLRKCAHKIEQTAFRISKIVKGLRTFSRDGSTEPFQICNLKYIFDETLELCSERFRVQAIDFKLDLPTHDVFIECRQVEIGQVLLNLLNNAFDAVSEQEQKEIQLAVDELEDSVVIKVVDNGKGISEVNKEKVFQPFFTTKEVGKGTGLGLSISLGIVKNHNGELNYFYEDGRAHFHIHLPLNQN